MYYTAVCNARRLPVAGLLCQMVDQPSESGILCSFYCTFGQFSSLWLNYLELHVNKAFAVGCQCRLWTATLTKNQFLQFWICIVLRVSKVADHAAQEADLCRIEGCIDTRRHEEM
jgi:hypothetical protein